jgi:hypothetical protein
MENLVALHNGSNCNASAQTLLTMQASSKGAHTAFVQERLDGSGSLNLTFDHLLAVSKTGRFIATVRAMLS